jgi:hypothetical protein
MIVWRGLGILVPFIAIPGAVVGSVLTLAVGHPDAGLGVGLGMAAAGNWFVWNRLTARQSKVMVDPQTGQQVMVKPKHSLFFVPTGVWTWPIACFAVLMFFAGAGSSDRLAEEEATPGYQEFGAANKQINPDSNGRVHGNTAAAKAAVESFLKKC